MSKNQNIYLTVWHNLLKTNPKIRPSKGFISEFRKWLSEAKGGHLAEEFKEIGLLNFRPDFFSFDLIDDVQTLTIYEVEDTHPLSDEKLRNLAELWWNLDGEALELKLYVTDRYGLNVRELPLNELWWRFSRAEFENESRKKDK